MNELVGRLQRIAEDIGQIQDRAARSGSPAGNDPIERIQRVKQEVRIDLGIPARSSACIISRCISES